MEALFTCSSVPCHKPVFLPALNISKQCQKLIHVVGLHPLPISGADIAHLVGLEDTCSSAGLVGSGASLTHLDATLFLDQVFNVSKLCLHIGWGL